MWDDTTITDLTDTALEEELCGLSARVSAATCRFLLAVAEYDRRRGWESWECRDMAAWLSWKCGISPVTAREQVRVAKALPSLPRLREEFGAGRLSYSQARAISRVATPETEELLVGWAAACTGAQLERITRAYRRCSAAAAEVAEKRQERRFLSYHWDDEGNLVGQFCLPAEAGAVLRAAIEEATDRASIETAESGGARDAVGAARADALVELVTVGAAGSEDGDDRSYLVTIVADQQVLAASAASDGTPAATGASRAPGEGMGPQGGLDNGTCQIADGPGLAAETARRIACDAPTVTIHEDPATGELLHVGRRTRRINRTLRRALRHRDRRCMFPGCERTRTQAHHVTHWVHGGPTDLSNLISLCPRHHHRLHEGGYRITVAPDGRFVFHHPSGWTIPQHPQAVTVPSPERPGPDVAAYESQWDGGPFDLATIVDVLLAEDGLLVPATVGGPADSAEAEARAS